MCGIAGFKGTGSAADLKKMTDAIAYRGPDGEGQYHVPEVVGLGHRRLSIIDLSPLGAQPMSNAEGTVFITFNGEIYNYKELRADLEKRHTFKSKTDTEALIYLYEEEGEHMWKKVQGMFSIGIYDTKKKLLMLARDRFGKKPMYWTRVGDTVVFGSEIKALLAHPLVKKEIDMDALSEYLTYEYIPAPRSIIKGISKLPAAHYLLFDGKEVSIKRFWSINVAPSNISYEDAVLRLRELLSEGVRKRLMSDVPLGVLLSGGIDSSTVAYFAGQHSATPVETFSIGFKEESFDESGYAREVAEQLGTNHHELIVSQHDALREIPEIYRLLDEPLADSSLIPTYVLSRFTRSRVTVALGGDGGDELLSGYDTFAALPYVKAMAAFPSGLRSMLADAASLLPVSDKNISFDFKIKQFLRGIGGAPAETNQRWLSSFLENEKALLLNNGVAQKGRTIKAHLVEVLAEMGGRKLTPFQEVTTAFIRTYLTDDILSKVDHASMYHSLEVRAPLLDTDVAEFLLSLPDDFKYQKGNRKRILKDAMKDLLPYNAVFRKKKGFGIPLASWLRGELKPLVDELLSKDFLAKQGIFNPEYVERVIAEHMSKKADHRKKLWTLLVFQMWYNNWYVS